ncbi:hypothetical protein [Granulicella sp. dw_53]|uniref:hypothetical protein n=1 Tax=Granulicella sp. dw_53 TaxID=2719792 RepID=UPI001BD68B16|nr:hypothetical protein [Granulicella sp. dw_53]
MLRLNKTIALSVFTACLAASTPGDAQAPESTATAEVQSLDKGLADVIYLAGLPDAKPRIKGVLILTPNALSFTSEGVHALIPLKRIFAVSIGDERVERGGTTGQIARKIIPYGGGAALGAASQHSVDLLTIEYRDPHDGYHGTVFVLPTKQALALQQRMLAQIQPPATVTPQVCPAGAAAPNSVLLAPIVVEGVDLPAEYRVLLYEHLLTALRQSRPADTFFRDGDVSAGPGCAALTLHLSTDDFKKGNQAVRASTGPLGLFLGTTSLSFRLKLDAPDGKLILEAKLKKSKRGDSDSLNLAQSIAKDISKRIDKALKKSKASGSTV